MYSLEPEISHETKAMQIADGDRGSSEAGKKAVSVAPDVRTYPAATVGLREPAWPDVATLRDIPIDRMRAWGLRGASASSAQHCAPSNAPA